MKAKQILKAMAFNDDFGGFKGIVTIDSVLTCEEDVIECLERQLGEINAEESLMDNFLPDADYFYTETPLTDETTFNDGLTGVLPVDNIVELCDGKVLNFYKIED